MRLQDKTADGTQTSFPSDPRHKEGENYLTLQPWLNLHSQGQGQGKRGLDSLTVTLVHIRPNSGSGVLSSEADRVQRTRAPKALPTLRGPLLFLGST